MNIRKMMFLGILLSFNMTLISFANEAHWKTEYKDNAIKYQYVMEDGNLVRSSWKWIDSNGSGEMKSYCFDENGYLYIDTKTPDNYMVNEYGAWTLDGNVMIKFLGPGFVGKAEGENRPPLKASISDEDIDEFFKNSVFIGDSVMQGFRNYCARSKDPFLKNLDFLASGSFSAHNAFWSVSSKSKHPMYKGSQRPVWESVKMIGDKNVYICLGLNDLNAGKDAVEKYTKLIKKIIEYNPGVNMNIISMTYTYKDAGKNRLNNENIKKFNEDMKNIATENSWGFINLADPLSDESGNLKAEYCSDKYVHHTNKAYAVWRDVLREYGRSKILKK